MEEDVLRDIKERTQRYAELGRVSRELKDLEKEVYTAILKYLLVNHYNLAKCTLRAMERELKIPYTRLRRLVHNLMNDSILQQVQVGKANAVRVIDYEKAIAKKYVTPNSSDLMAFVSMAMPRCFTFRNEGSLWSGVTLWGLPKAPLRLPHFDVVWGVLRHGEDVLKSAPARWIPNFKKVLKDSAHWTDEEIDRLLSSQAFKAASKYGGTLKAWSDLVERGGALFWCYLPFVRTTTSPPAREKQIIEEEMEDVRRWLPHVDIVPLPHLTHPDPYLIYYREILFELDCTEEATASSIRGAAKAVAEKQLKLLMLMLKPLCTGVATKGLNSMADSSMRSRDLTKASILYEIICLKYAAMWMLALDGDRKLFSKAREMIDTLEKAIKDL